MFGKNPIRPILRDPLKLAIEGAWYTLQGEGPYAGCPALFIRLAGCNLACTFCDTQFETQAEYLRDISDINQQLGNIPKDQRRLVVLTGGEPLRQNCEQLVANLLQTGTDVVQIETAGTCWQPGLETYIRAGRVVLVCSPKTAHVHENIIKFCNHWKYIIRGGGVSQVDGLPNQGTQIKSQGQEVTIYRPHFFGPQRYHQHPQPMLGVSPTIWLSPCDEYDPVLNKINQDLARDLCLKHGYRLSLQIHKLIEVE